MNSKILIVLTSLLFISSCGVKAPPKKYSETAIDSYIKDFTGTDEHIKKTAAPETKPATTPAKSEKK